MEGIASCGVDGKPGHKVVHHAFGAGKNVLPRPVAAAVVRVLVGHPGAIAVLFTKDQVQAAVSVVHGNGHAVGAAKAGNFVSPAPALGCKGDLVRKPCGCAVVVRTVEPQGVVNAPNDRDTAQRVHGRNGPFGRFVVVDAIPFVGGNGHGRRPGDAAVLRLRIADARAVEAAVRFSVFVKFRPGNVQGVSVGIHGNSLFVLVLGGIVPYAAPIAPGLSMVVAPLDDYTVQPIPFLVRLSAGVGQMQEVDATCVVVLQNGVAIHPIGRGQGGMRPVRRQGKIIGMHLVQDGTCHDMKAIGICSYTGFAGPFVWAVLRTDHFHLVLEGVLSAQGRACEEEREGELFFHSRFQVQFIPGVMPTWAQVPAGSSKTS